MEIGSESVPSCFQRALHCFCTGIVVTRKSQTELVINTHAMVTGIYRTIVQGQEGSNSTHPSVSGTYNLSITE